MKISQVASKLRTSYKLQFSLLFSTVLLVISNTSLIIPSILSALSRPSPSSLLTSLQRRSSWSLAASSADSEASCYFPYKPLNLLLKSLVKFSLTISLMYLVERIFSSSRYCCLRPPPAPPPPVEPGSPLLVLDLALEENESPHNKILIFFLKK